MKKILLISVCAFLAIASVGCGKKKPDGMPDLQPTLLTVTQGGAPLSGAMVNLKSTDASNKWTCGGTTDEKGVAALVTHGQYKGVPIGKYKVSVNKTIGEGDPPPRTPFNEETARAWKEYHDAGKTYEEFYVVDQKYATVDATPLEIEVVKGKNNLTADVGEAVKIPIKQSSGVVPTNIPE
ncbi:MAG: carboxypeptidase regulatory-like domain-containing protein [Thermoguttaceae bacterium]|nr:carboxypeptidase regulatory-like domain-containing protein [Thermoguttaceae bacterium]